MAKMPYNKENKKKYSAARYEANREEIIARQNRCARTLKGRFSKLKSRAKDAGLPMEFALEEYSALLNSAVCHYCEGRLNETGSGLDRKNSTLGYSEENCVPCCLDCNMIRGKDRVSYSEMLQVAKLLNRLRSEPANADPEQNPIS